MAGPRRGEQDTGQVHGRWIDGLREGLGRADPGAPKHARLAAAMRALLRGGTVSAHDRLPPERVLAEGLGLSPGTVQKALGALATEGLIVRELGRGTFVAGSRTTFSGPWHFRFVRDGSDQILPVRSAILGRRLSARRGPWSDALGEDRAGFVVITRRIAVNEDYACFSQTWHPASRFGALLEIPAAELAIENLRMTMAERFGVPVSNSEQRVSTTVLTATVCRRLGIAADTVGTVMDVVGYTYGQRPVYYAALSFPPGPYRMLQALLPMRWN